MKDERKTKAQLIKELTRKITEREQTEEALRESREEYMGIVEDSPALVCTFDPHYNLKFVNEKYCEAFDKKRHELVGRTFLSLIPESDRENVKANIARLTSTDPINQWC